MSSGVDSGEQKDLRFANLAVKKGFLEQARLQDVLKIQKDFAARGESKRLPSLVIQAGAMSAFQVREVLSELERTTLECPGCGSAFDISGFPPGKKFLCKRCKTVNVVPGAVEPLRTPPTQAQIPSPAQDMAVTIAEVQDTAAAAPGPASEPEAMGGKVIGGCRIERKLGSGGMGIVYLARQVSLDRPIALKILPRNLAANDEYIARFEREARAVANLNHPNIVQVHDMGRDAEGFYYIVMEYVDGSTFSELVKEKGPLDEKTALRALRQACAGLAAAHDAGIIHRDIKPENIMITKAGRVKVTDFGLAKETKGDSQLTGTGIALGTPAYMAPEQGMGEIPDRRSDIYALGATLYTMLTARLPYDAKSPLSMMMKHATDPIPLARQANPEVTEPTEKFICKAMAKKPDDRFIDMNQMKEALDFCIQDLASSKEAPPEPAAPPERAEAAPPDRRRGEITPGKAPRVPTPAAGQDKEPARASRKTGEVTPGKGARVKEEAEAVPEQAPSAGRGGEPTPAKTKAASAVRGGRKDEKEKEEEAPEEGGRGRKTSAARRGMAASAPSGGGKGKVIALVGGGLGAVALIVVVAVLIALNSGGGGKGPGKSGEGSSGGGTKEDPANKDTGTGTPKPDPGGTKKADPPPKDPRPAADEPEGSAEPPSLPSGIRKGDKPGEYVNAKDGSVLVWVPAGRATLGLSEGDLAAIKLFLKFPSSGAFRQSGPARSVYLDGFFIGKYEVTNEQYDSFLEWCKAHPGERDQLRHPSGPESNSPLPEYWKQPKFSDLEAPVVGVDWFDAWAYAKWAELDLPTEAQWEKAAHWDFAAKKRRLFPWGDEPELLAPRCADVLAGKRFDSVGEAAWWFRELSPDKEAEVRPASVTSLKRDVSPCGAVGMAGNVSEWCRDYFHHYFLLEPDASARNAYDNAYYPARSVRGGCYRSNFELILVRKGWYTGVGKSSNTIGFRVAKPLVQPPPDVPPVPPEDELRALPPPVQKRTVQGMLQDFWLDDNWEAVIARARWAIKSFPEEADLLSRLGLALANKNELSDGALYLQDAVKMDAPDTKKADMLVSLGTVLLLSGDRKGALDAFEKSIAAAPFQSDAYYERGRFKMDKAEDSRGAIEDFERALQYTEGGDGALNSIGLAYRRLREHEKALKYLSLAVKGSPRNKFFLYDRGETLLDLKRNDEAKADFQKLVELKDYLHGYYGLAQFYYAVGNIAQAKDFAQKAVPYGKECRTHRDSAQKLLERIEKEQGGK
ncbi:MAG: SUMF1/EgtB/PvdO family nonheme iron enzyme [Planctomycetes bacterium]|nr:SUMF1/EgtB/PvdO family nonheme iron enzyme [Planctomycetota bacterium]